jgi:hypothetical protein
MGAGTQAPTLQYSVVFRLGEQYLIKAEADANSGDSTDAIVDLNSIRSRAGLGSYNLVSNGPLLPAIMHERQVELFTEWGHRWFDLQRTGTINAVMGSPGDVCSNKGGQWSPNWQLFPVALSELEEDPNLIQTPGYQY